MNILRAIAAFGILTFLVAFENVFAAETDTTWQVGDQIHVVAYCNEAKHLDLVLREMDGTHEGMVRSNNIWASLLEDGKCRQQTDTFAGKITQYVSGSYGVGADAGSVWEIRRLAKPAEFLYVALRDAAGPHDLAQTEMLDNLVFLFREMGYVP